MKPGQAQTVPITLWVTDISVATPPRAWKVLSKDEHARAQQIKRAEDRKRWVNARFFLREVLALETGTPAWGLVFTLLPGGKPVLDDDRSGITFNLSHADDTATVATARTRFIGVDVETQRTRHTQLTAIERFALSERERAEVLALPGERRSAILYTAWRRKEALLKAAGTGISHAMKSIDVGPLNAPLTTSVAIPAGPNRGDPCRIYDIPLDDTRAAAIAVSGHDHRIDVRIFDIQPEIMTNN